MIKLLKTKNSIEPIMAVDDNANAHCVWLNNGLYCYSRFNGIDWEYLNDCKIIDSITTNTAVPKNGLCPDSNGNPYILWAKSNYEHIFGQLSSLYLTYWDNHSWKKIEQEILLEVLYGSSLVFFNNDLYIGSLIFKNSEYLFTISIYQDGIFTQLNSYQISALSMESKVVLKQVNDKIYCFWQSNDNTNYWIEHIIYDVGTNSFSSTLTRKINFSNDNIPISGFDFATDIPGGVLAWTKISTASSSINACKLNNLVETTIGSTVKINPDPEFIFQNIIGQSIFTQDFKSPSIYFNNIEEPRVMSVTNEILSFIYGDGQFNEEKYKINTQYIPKKIIASKKPNGKIAGYCYFNDNNIYAFEIDDEIDFSSSSSSSGSSITISTLSLSSSSSSQKRLSSESSQSSGSTGSSGSSSSLSVSSSSSLSSFNSSSSSLSSLSSSSLSSLSSKSSGSSSSLTSF